MKNKIFIALIAVLWLVIIGGLILWKQAVLWKGQEVFLPVSVVDPRDMFRGDYVDLNYNELTSLGARLGCEGFSKQCWTPQPGETVYVSLTNKNVQEKNTYRPIKFSKNQPSGILFIKGVAQEGPGFGFIIVKYGIESYFVPEGKGLELERKLRDGMLARVYIKSGEAVLKELVEK